MNYEEFQELFDSDRHSLADLIREGEIPFNTCLEAHGRVGMPPLILSAMLVHPDCELGFFKRNYRPLVSKVGDIARNEIIPQAKALRDTECVAEVMNADEPTIEGIIKAIELFQYRHNYPMLKKNPYISTELKLALYDIDKDETLLPKDVQDMFIF